MFDSPGANFASATCGHEVMIYFTDCDAMAAGGSSTILFLHETHVVFVS